MLEESSSSACGSTELAMSTSTPLVGTAEEGEARQSHLVPGSIQSDEIEANEDQSCRMRRHRKPCMVGTALFFLVGFSLLLWGVLHHGGSSDSSSDLRPLDLNSMFNRSLSPSRASIAWLTTGDGAASGSTADQFISVTNGSFYVTTLPAYDAPVKIIDQADLTPFAQTYTPSVQSAHTSRRLQSLDPRADAASLRASHRGGRPSAPRMMRAKPAHANARLMHSQQYVAHDSVHPLHTQAASSSPAAVSDGAKFVYSSYTLSPDQSRMLFGVNCTQLYRHSSFCSYTVYDISSKTMSPLAAGAQLRLATFSPDSQRLAFVRDNNIFVQTIANGAIKQVTTDGLWDHVINGVMDWVYEEEIAEATSALWWSPDGASLAFLRFNETSVPVYGFDFYTSPYNQGFSYKYPKAGFPNSIVDVHVYNSTSDTLYLFAALRDVSFEYVINVEWYSSSSLLVRVENRAQNHWQLLKLSVVSGVDTITPLSSATAKFYFEPNTLPVSLSPLPLYVDLVSDGDDHLQLAVFSIDDGALVKFITGGEFDVLSLNAVRVEGEDAVFYYTRELTQTAAQIAVPTLWSVRLATLTNGSDSQRLVPYDDDTDRLTWQSGSFSPSGRYFLLQESAVVPTSILYATNTTGAASVLVVLANNAELVATTAATYSVPTTTYLSLPSTLPGLQLSVQVLSPAGTSLDECKGLPVLIYAYSGPGSQQVTTTYPISYGSTSTFHAALVSASGFIVVVVDTVGTSGKGEEYRKAHTYLRLGIQERDDIIATTKWIAKQEWADEEKINYWGWSYGGFMTSFTAAAGTDLYANLISVAPVTDWRLYDSVYTERYMLRPIDNPAGYDNTSVIHSASGAFDANWHLFGGTADDNVHFQNSALLVDALINLDVPLSVFYFPNRAHSLLQWKTGAPPRYLYEMLLKLLTGSGGPSAAVTHDEM